MALKKRIFVIAFFITLFLFLSIVLLGNMLSEKRTAYIDAETDSTYGSLQEMQTFSLMIQTYGPEMACLAFNDRMQELDGKLWKLGQKLDQYRQASEEFTKDEYYLDQKKEFNENEVMYLLFLQQMKKECDNKQIIILFFYKNSTACDKCDDQSFVLTDINTDINDDVSIFSFDADLGVNTVDLLTKYYKVTTYPCTVIEDEVLCGIQSKTQLLEQICEENPRISVCPTMTVAG